jgi:hypothetical protein
MIKIDLPAEGADVISLTLVRDSRLARKFTKKCTHNRIEVDTTLSEMLCLDCKEKLNPVQWVADMIEEWHRIDDLTRRNREAAANYEAKRRCRCEHCNKITNVRPPSLAEVTAFRKSKP